MVPLFFGIYICEYLRKITKYGILFNIDEDLGRDENMCGAGISVCIITKNECEGLRKCLESLSGYGFELVVADTGSTDNTVSMVREYTESLYEFPWVNDFAAARNYVVSMAKNDTVLIVDSDEYLISGDVSGFCNFALNHPTAIGQIRQREYTPNEQGNLEESIIGLARVFNRRHFHYAGRVHEQLVRGDVFSENRDDSREMLVRRREEKPLDGYETGLLFGHDGYAGTAEERGKKAERNVALLLEEVEAHPYAADLLYQTAKSVYVARGAEASLEFYERALSCDLNPSVFWVKDMIVCYGYVLLELSRYEQALSLEAVYDDLSGSADYVFLMGLIHMNNAMFDRAIDEFVRCTQMETDRSIGTNSFKAYYNAGVIEEVRGNTGKAREYYSSAGEYEPAIAGLQRLKGL